MTEPSHLYPDDFETMTPEQLREGIRRRQEYANKLSLENQSLGFNLRKREEEARQLGVKVEELEKKQRLLKIDLDAVVEERNSANRFAALLFEKLELLSAASAQRRPKDIRQVMALFHESLKQVARITAWPELSNQQLFEQLFVAAEKRVFGTGAPPKPKKGGDFIAKSVAKKNAEKK